MTSSRSILISRVTCTISMLNRTPTTRDSSARMIMLKITYTAEVHSSPPNAISVAH